MELLSSLWYRDHSSLSLLFRVKWALDEFSKETLDRLHFTRFFWLFLLLLLLCIRCKLDDFLFSLVPEDNPSLRFWVQNQWQHSFWRIVLYIAWYIISKQHARTHAHQQTAHIETLRNTMIFALAKPCKNQFAKPCKTLRNYAKLCIAKLCETLRNHICESVRKLAKANEIIFAKTCET